MVSSPQGTAVFIKISIPLKQNFIYNSILKMEVYVSPEVKQLVDFSLISSFGCISFCLKGSTPYFETSVKLLLQQRKKMLYMHRVCIQWEITACVQSIFGSSKLF